MIQEEEVEGLNQMHGLLQGYICASTTKNR